MRLSRRRFVQGAALSGAAAGSLGAYAFWVEPRLRLVETHYHIASPVWGDRADIKIVALADFHFCEPWMPLGRVERIVERANAQKPDLIFLLGDYAPGIGRFRTSVLKMSDWAFELSKLEARLGVHAVLGNHDWWSDGEAYGDAIRKTGARLYVNDAQRIRENGGFWITGTDSMLAEPLSLGGFRDRSNVEAVLDRVPRDEPALHLMHEPDLFPKVQDPMFLSFAGHTHGGQVRLPLVGRPVVPSRFGQRYAYGHVEENGRHLVVSGGLGVSIAPVRFRTPPEITIVRVSGV